MVPDGTPAAAVPAPSAEPRWRFFLGRQRSAQVSPFTEMDGARGARGAASLPPRLPVAVTLEGAAGDAVRPPAGIPSARATS